MLIKSLKIYTPNQVIRDLKFHKGLNLIIDKTIGGSETGNNVGKTTVLRLIDFCLGKDSSCVYVDTENKRLINEDVKSFLIDNEVEVELTLVDSTDENRTVVICRNFLRRTKAVRTINGEQIQERDFESELGKAILGEYTIKPTFRQIISHNLRIDDWRLSNTMKTLDPYTSLPEYEMLYLYMFGCHVASAEERQKQLKDLQTHQAFKKRLAGRQGKGAFQAKLGIVNAEIEKLEKEREQLHLNPNFEADIARQNEIKRSITSLSSEINALNIRQDIIEEAIEDYNSQRSDVDLQQLAYIYKQAKALVPEVHHTFEEMVKYHNSMLEQKAAFISADLPGIKEQLAHLDAQLDSLISEERQLGLKLQSSTTYNVIEELIAKTNEQYRQKGELEKVLQQIEETEKEIETITNLLSVSGTELFSAKFQSSIQQRVDAFNTFFSDISTELYDEQYAVKCDVVETKTGQSVYQFNTFNANFSTGKKQGEITCFDIAYTLFADKYQIPCLHFLLSDKKELVHDNQLSKIAMIVNSLDNIQFVASILQDKLPSELNNDSNIVVRLSPDDKLFRF